MPTNLSSRTLSRTTGTFVRTTPGSQSLERGLDLLRAFRTSGSILTNAELADRTQLPRPTVSRLMHSLVDSGFVAYDRENRGYRLSAACLSLALSFRTSEKMLEIALPPMRELAEGRQLNAGLAVADQLDMVYLESIRKSRLGIFRRMVAGSRIPIARTSLGCAYLAGLNDTVRTSLVKRLRLEHANEWAAMGKQINESIEAVHKQGYCSAQWQAGVTSVATPILTPNGDLYALNVSFPASLVDSSGLRHHGKLLLELADAIRRRI